jgi:hypothetical protein
MMIQEKQTTNAIAFNVNVRDPAIHVPATAPEIKKKLEEAANMRAAQGPAITLE